MTMPSVEELVVDSFAGGGGASEGIRQALGRDPDIAVNHDALALAMHRVNHPGTRHLVQDVCFVDSVGMCAGRPIGMLWMSPDCTDHSKAKGAPPKRGEKNTRGLAWAIVGWVKALPPWQRPRVIFLENVEEFEDWGPVLENGRRCPLRKGAIFREFVATLRALGYTNIEWRQRRAWKAGGRAATIRKRLFLVARRDGEPIVWPDPKAGNPNDPVDAARINAGALKPWRTAADILDFGLPCPSILDTRAEIKRRFGLQAVRPLAVKTMARVAKGTGRHVVKNPRPFVVKVNHTGRDEDRSAETTRPLATMTGHRDDALVTPVMTYAQQGGASRSAQSPLHTLTASRKDQNSVVMPLVAGLAHGDGAGGDRREYAAEEPLTTIHAGGGNQALVTPFVAPVKSWGGGGNDPRSAEEPTRTDTASKRGEHALVAPFVTKFNSGSTGHPAPEPLHTVTAHASETHGGGAAPLGVVASHLMMMRGSQKPWIEPPEPMHTITAGGASPALVAPVLVPRYGEREGQEPRHWPVDIPMPTEVPTGNGAGVVAVHLQRQFGASIGSGAEEPTGTDTAGVAKTALAAAFLAQHNGGPRPGDRGHAADAPISTIATAGAQQQLVAAHLTHAYTSNTRGGEGDPEKPINTTTAGGQHEAVAASFLAKYFGTGLPSQSAAEPLHTQTSKPRHGLVEVLLDVPPFGPEHEARARQVAEFLRSHGCWDGGEFVTIEVEGITLVIVDIGMRMLTPRERFNAQGFRPDYIIDHGILEDGSRVEFTLEQQGRMCGNSVCPDEAEALVAANYRPREVRVPRRRADTSPTLFVEAAE